MVTQLMALVLLFFKSIAYTRFGLFKVFYDALMATSAQINFELAIEVIEKAEQVIKAHGMEIEEYPQKLGIISNV